MTAQDLVALGASVAACLSAVGMWVSVRVELAATKAGITAQISALQSEVQKHNQVVERTFRLEEQVKTMYRLHDELKADVEAHHPPKVGGTD